MDPALCDGYVIFLDVDGVLLPVPKFTFGGGDLSSACVQRLRQIVDAAGGSEKVTIVLSSTWRNDADMMRRLNDFIERETAGAVPIVTDGTPKATVLVSSVAYYAEDPTEQRLVRDRVDEIYRWLHTHVTEHPEAIGGRWFAIDDMQLDVDPRMVGHFLHTETDVGIRDDDVATCVAMLASHASPEEAYAAALAAQTDPKLKEEEIEIQKVLHSRLEAQLATARAELTEAQGKVTALMADKKELRRELAEKQRAIEDMRYRLAVNDYTKRFPVLAAAVELAGTRTGAERRDIDANIRAFVALLMERKELQRKMRSASKKFKQGS